MLDIRNLSVEVENKTILSGINLHIGEGEVVILFGPNGSGKSTLIKSALGFSGYGIVKGDIVFRGRNINDMPTEGRVKLGMGAMYQHPPAIRGVTLRQVARYLSKDDKQIEQLARKLSLLSHLDRDINLNFSGGEMKRSELFQLLLQDPDLLLLDEPESGVDLENISLMGTVLNEFIKTKGKSALIITHTGYILDYLEAKRGCIMFDGKFWCIGNPKTMFKEIRESGYGKCVVCHERKESE